MAGVSRVIRERAILEDLQNHGAVRVTELAERLDVSEMTLRRDLAGMDSEGKLVRVHGGAIPLENPVPSFRQRNTEAPEAKRRIGMAAVDLIQPGQVVYIDSGSSGDAVAEALSSRALRENLDMRVVTPAVNVAAQLAGVDGIHLTMLGGEISPVTLAADGPAVLPWIEDLRFDLFFLGAGGVDPEAGWGNDHPNNVALKRAVHERSAKTWAVVDSRKWGRRAYHRILPLDAIHGWIVDAEVEDDAAARARSEGVEVVVAK